MERLLTGESMAPLWSPASLCLCNTDIETSFFLPRKNPKQSEAELHLRFTKSAVETLKSLFLPLLPSARSVLFVQQHANSFQMAEC